MVYDIFKEFKMQKTKGGEEYLANISKDSPARKILESEIKHKPNFDKDEV